MQKVECEVFRFDDGSLQFHFPGTGRYSFSMYLDKQLIYGGVMGGIEDCNGRKIASAINNRLEWRNMVGVE